MIAKTKPRKAPPAEPDDGMRRMLRIATGKTAQPRPESFANAEPLRGRGRRLASTVAALTERDGLLREAAGRFYPGASLSEAARRLHTALLRYRGGPWRREGSASSCPPRHHGRLAAHLWKILKAHDTALSERRIRYILGRELPAINGQRISANHC